MNQTASELLKRIESKSAVVGIVGLGYVGLPLSKALLESGYAVVGYDIDQRKIDGQRPCPEYNQNSVRFSPLRCSCIRPAPASR